MQPGELVPKKLFDQVFRVHVASLESAKSKELLLKAVFPLMVLPVDEPKMDIPANPVSA